MEKRASEHHEHHEIEGKGERDYKEDPKTVEEEGRASETHAHDAA